jgi:transcriptional regulator with XRE-family HTH domain
MITMGRPLVPPNSAIDQLLDKAQEKIQARNRTELLTIIGMQPPTVSKIRHNRVPVSAEMILRLHDATALPVDYIREKLGVKPFFDLDAHTNAQQSGAQQTAQNQGSN